VIRAGAIRTVPPVAQVRPAGAIRAAQIPAAQTPVVRIPAAQTPVVRIPAAQIPAVGIRVVSIRPVPAVSILPGAMAGGQAAIRATGVPAGTDWIPGVSRSWGGRPRAT
jgi:hypothetical protein